jgi:hypothetical protein
MYIDRIVGAPSPAQGKKASPALLFTTNTEALFLDATGGTATLSALPASGPLGATTAPSYPGVMDGIPFKVRACFKVTTGGTSTVIIAIYAGTTITSGNKVASITSPSLATASTSGWLEAYLIWDNVAQKFSGYQVGAFGTATPLANTALSNTAVTVTTSLATMQFVCTGNMGTGSITSTMVLTDFGILDI